MANRLTLADAIVAAANTGKVPAELAVLDTVTGASIANGTQVANITDPSSTVEITYTAGTVKTTVGSQTVADRDAPSDAELMDLIDELNAGLAALDTKIATIISALEAFGITASS